MIDPLLPTGDGHTELPDEDRANLIPTHIATLGDLFDAEQRNIAQALLRRSPATDELLTDAYLRGLHQAMFRQVWAWAGVYRIRETNIGFAPHEIAASVRMLVDDAKAWVEFGTYEPDEIAIRFHHRLVAIHPFPNGNGRLGRIAADYFVHSLGAAPFTWGSGLDVDTDVLRSKYIGALQRADGGNIADLLAFART